MVKQYPDTATVTYASEATTLPNGDIVPGQTITDTFKCRQEPAGRGGFITASDGTQIAFSSNVYADKRTEIVPVGAQISVIDKDANETVSGTVKRFSRGQLNCRLWV